MMPKVNEMKLKNQGTYGFNVAMTSLTYLPSKLIFEILTSRPETNLQQWVSVQHHPVSSLYTTT
jgi:hypothetical protein